MRMCKYCFCNLVFLFYLICNLQYSFGLSTSSNDILIVSSLDGRLSAFNANNGQSLWSVENRPILEQSLQNLEFERDDRLFRVVPSIDGNLYLLEGTKRLDNNHVEFFDQFRSLPLDVNGIIQSNFQITENSILTGSKELSVFALRVKDGKLLYNCSRAGCVRSKPVHEGLATEHSDVILIRDTFNLLREVSLQDGIEHWNYSIRDEQISLLPGNETPNSMLKRAKQALTSTYDEPVTPRMQPEDSETSVGDVHFNFDLKQRTIHAKSSGSASSRIWSMKLDSPLVKAWVYRPGSAIVTSSVNSISLFANDPLAMSLITKQQPSTGANTPCCMDRFKTVFLGQFDNHFYLQLEDMTDKPKPTSIRLDPVEVSDDNVHRILPDHLIDDLNSEMVGFYRTGSVNQASTVGPYRFQSRNGNRLPARWRRELPQIAWQQPDLTEEETEDSLSELIYYSASDFVALFSGEGFLQGSTSAYRKNHQVRLRLPTSYFLPHIMGLLIMLFSFFYLVYRFMPHERLVEPTNHRHEDQLAMLLAGRGSISSSTTTSASSTTEEIRLPKSLPDNNNNNISVEKTKPPTLTLARLPEDSELQILKKQTSLSESCSARASFQSTYEMEFQHVRRLGRGGFGQVFEVENRLDGCRYAIKRIKLENSQNEREKFMREVKVWATLDHPGIVRYHRAWIEAPPDQWQEERDRFLMHDLEDDFDSSEDYTEESRTDCSIATTSNQLRSHPILGLLSKRSSVSSFLLKSEQDPFANLHHIQTSSNDDEEWADEEVEASQAFSRTFYDDDSSEDDDEPGSRPIPGTRSDHSTAKNSPATSKFILGDAPEDDPENDQEDDSRHRRIALDHTQEFISQLEKSIKADSDLVFKDEPFVGFHAESVRRMSCLKLSSQHKRRQASFHHDDQLSSTNHFSPPATPLLLEARYCYLYIQMQLCLPHSLRDWLQERSTDQSRPLRPILYGMFHQILEAVHYLHCKSLMHRDLKPSNILFDTERRIKLADFGLVTRLFDDSPAGLENVAPVTAPVVENGPKKRVRNSNSECQAFKDESWMCPRRTVFLDRRHTDNVGTLLYMSPEQERGEAYDQRVDVFSLGLIFIELMMPFSTAMERIHCLTRAKKQDLPEEFVKRHAKEASLAQTMLNADPKRRPQIDSLLGHEIFRPLELSSNSSSKKNKTLSRVNSMDF